MPILKTVIYESKLLDFQNVKPRRHSESPPPKFFQ